MTHLTSGKKLYGENSPSNPRGPGSPEDSKSRSLDYSAARDTVSKTTERVRGQFAPGPRGLIK